MIDQKCQLPSIPPAPKQESLVFAVSSMGKLKAEIKINGGGSNETAVPSPLSSSSTSRQSSSSAKSFDADIDVLSCTTTPMPPSLDGLRLSSAAGNGLASDSGESSCWGGEKDKKYFCQRCLNHKEEHPRKSHKPFCRYRDCKCDECKMVERRRMLNNALSTRKPGEGKNGKEQPQNGPKPRNPKCARCSAHGGESALRGHKKSLCPFRTCECEKCKLVVERRQLMAAQIKLRRKQKKEREAGNQMEEATTDGIQMSNNPSPLIGQKVSANGKKTSNGAQRARKRLLKAEMAVENGASLQSAQIVDPQQPYFLASSSISTPPQHPTLQSPNFSFIHFPAALSGCSQSSSPITQPTPPFVAQNVTTPLQSPTNIVQPLFTQSSSELLQQAVNIENLARQTSFQLNPQQNAQMMLTSFEQIQLATAILANQQQAVRIGAVNQMAEAFGTIGEELEKHQMIIPFVAILQGILQNQHQFVYNLPKASTSSPSTSTSTSNLKGNIAQQSSAYRIDSLMAALQENQ